MQMLVGCTVAVRTSFPGAYDDARSPIFKFPTEITGEPDGKEGNKISQWANFFHHSIPPVY